MSVVDDVSEALVARVPKETLTWHYHPSWVKNRVARHDRRTSGKKVEKMFLALNLFSLDHT